MYEKIDGLKLHHTKIQLELFLLTELLMMPRQ